MPHGRGLAVVAAENHHPALQAGCAESTSEAAHETLGHEQHSKHVNQVLGVVAREGYRGVNPTDCREAWPGDGLAANTEGFRA